MEKILRFVDFSCLLKNVQSKSLDVRNSYSALFFLTRIYVIRNPILQIIDPLNKNRSCTST